MWIVRGSGFLITVFCVSLMSVSKNERFLDTDLFPDFLPLGNKQFHNIKMFFSISINILL